MKKVLSLVLSLLLAATMLPALGAAEAKAPLFAEPFEITILAPTWQPYDTSVTAIWEKVEELTNVKLNFNWAPQTDYDTKVATVLASGVDAMPDLIAGLGTTIPLLLDQGAIIPLDSYLEEFAPNVMAAMTEEDMVNWREFFDGQIYTLPIVMDLPGGMSYMIRADWLKRVGKEVPTNWDEFIDVLRAFKAQDANGDGDPSNEIPFALDAKNISLDAIMYMFGINPSANGQFCILEDGTYTLVYEHPNFQKFAEAVQMMFKEGLLDPEFATPRDQDMLFQIMDNNTTGCTLTWAERCRISTEVNQTVDPEAEWICIAPIAGPDGDAMMRARAKLTKSYTVTVGAEKRGKVDKIIEFINWVYSEEGNLLMNYGIEGTHYDMVDGKPILRPEYKTGFVAARQAGLIHQPFLFNWSIDVYMQILTGGVEYENLTAPQQRFFDGLFTINNDYFAVQPLTYQTEAFIEYQAEVITAVKVLRDKLFSGMMTYDEFRAEYNKLLPRGLQDIIDQGNDAYQKLLGN